MAVTDILHSEIQRPKILSIQFSELFMVQFSPSLILGSVSTWMRGYA